MKKNCGSIVEFGRKLIKTLVDSFSYGVYADEVEKNEVDEGSEEEKSSSKSTINYEDLIAKARKEEKEKQYKKIGKLENQIDALTNQHNVDLLKIAELEKNLKEMEEKLTSIGKGDSDEVITLKKEIELLKNDKSFLEERVKTLETNKPVDREEVEKEIRAMLETEYEVKTYKATKLAEMKDELLVPELVIGDTKEEIDQSIIVAMERSNEIRKSLGITDKPRKTPRTPSNPSIDKTQDNEVDLDRLASLDVRSKEYAEMRKKLGLR